jgi:hypothetical protein
MRPLLHKFIFDAISREICIGTLLDEDFVFVVKRFALHIMSGAYRVDENEKSVMVGESLKEMEDSETDEEEESQDMEE